MTTSPTNSSVIINGFSTALSCATDSCKEASKSSRDYQYFEHRNKALVHYNDPSNAPWIMKDPRLCVTFKMWLEILHGAPPAVIFTYRNPLEVARSLQGRERETVELLGDGLKLWIWYNRLAVDNSKGLCRITTRCCKRYKLLCNEFSHYLLLLICYYFLRFCRAFDCTKAMKR